MDKKSNAVYVSGAMSGIPEHNIPEFERIGKVLSKLGFDNVILPHKLHKNPQKLHWHDFMAVDLCELMKKADVVCLLDGWEDSRGALTEVVAGIMKGCSFMRVNEDDSVSFLQNKEVTITAASSIIMRTCK
jgi:hypothetical protein